MKNIFNYILAASFGLLAASCSDFLEEQVPQGTLDENQVKDPSLVESTIISAYAGFTQSEDINGSFSMWNYDVRSDDAYKGGSSVNDGDVFHQLEVQKGVLTTNWNISDMWNRLYITISRINSAISVLEKCDDSYAFKAQRLAEMKFLRAYSHFLLKRLYKNIPFIMDANLKYEDYNTLSNTEYTNDEAWGVIAKELEEAYEVLPVRQTEKGRPTKAACAAFLAKVYLYKAYRQDDAKSNQVTSINAGDLEKVIKYTAPAIYSAGGYSLEQDIHNNFRPEEQYENGCESIWAIQYSRNDGSTYGNLNWSNGLICPNIADVTDGGCDFYKPSQNLVNAFRTDDSGLPLIDSFNQKDYDMTADNADPRLFLTVGITGLPYMFNQNYIMDRTSNWSRSGGLYGYYVTLKQNVDPALIDQYLIKGSFWATSMNRIVFRYADVMLERAEAFAQLGKTTEAIALVNQIRSRAAASTQMIGNYPSKYGVKFYCKNYTGSYDKEQTIKIVKMERRLELAMESERFFDLVRWGEAAQTLNSYYAAEKTKCTVYGEAEFTANKGEYLPIPFAQVAASNGNVVNDVYNGIIDQDAKTITVYVPGDVDVTALVPSIAFSDGAACQPLSGVAQDFTMPVVYTVTNGTAQAQYTVNVFAIDKPKAVFVGNASTMNDLDPEAKAACSWMLANIEKSLYVSFADIQMEAVDLSECKVIWWHFHYDGGVDGHDQFVTKASYAIDAKNLLRTYYENGGAFFLTRYATNLPSFIGATGDDEWTTPNNCWGQNEADAELCGGPWDFKMYSGQTGHSLWQGLVTGDDPNAVYTTDAGYHITNSTAQYHIGIDWGDYNNHEAWETRTGGKILGVGGDGAVVAWEYPAHDGKGGIICIGSGCYDWYSYTYEAGYTEKFHKNVSIITQNAFNYLTK